MAWTITVECAFATQPMAASPTWTDITAYVLAREGITRTWGRPDEFGQIQPSTLSLTLNNRDGRFTRSLTSSPYYPNVKNGKRIRVTGKHSGATVPVNLLRKAESDFEDGTVGNWVIGGGASEFISVATLPDEGSRSGRLTADGSGGAFLYNSGNSEDSAVWGETGDPFSGGIRLRSASATRSWRAVLRWLTATDVYHSQTNGTSISCGSGGYTQLSVSGTMPSGANKCLLQWESLTVPAGGEVWHADKAQLTKTATLQTWEAGPTFYRRFDGHVNEWPTAWVSGRATYAEATITATDRLKRFGQVGELRSLLEEEVLRDATVASAYFPLSEPSEANSAASITKQVQNTATITQVGTGGTLEFGAGTGPGTDGLSAPMFTPVSATAGKYLLCNLATPVGGSSNAVTLEAWFRTEGAMTSRAIAILETSAGSRVELVIDSSGNLQGSTVLGSDGSTVLLCTSANVVNDGLTHHAALTLSYSGGTVTGRLYLDGSQVDTDTYASTGLGACVLLRIGGRKNTVLFAGTISHVAAHSAALSAARILEHYSAGASGLAGERTDQRLGRFADYIGIPSADRTFDVGDGIMGAQSTSGQQPVEAMREVEAVEDGQLFVAGDGELTFHKRSRRYNAIPAVTLTGSQITPDLVFPGEDFGLTNDMTVTRPGGSPARWVDQASIDEFGLYRDSVEIPAGTDVATLAAAQWRVGNYGTPRTRVPNVTVELARLERDAPSQVALLLTADISTKLRLSSLPTQAPASTVDVFVEGGTETITSRFWRIAFNTSPGDFSSPVWQLGVAGFSELGVTSRLGQ
jgi:hypothetical protein